MSSSHPFFRVQSIGGSEMNAEDKKRVWERMERKKKQSGLFLANQKCVLLEKGLPVPICSVQIFWFDGDKEHIWRYDSEGQNTNLPSEVYEFLFLKQKQMIATTGIKGRLEVEIKNQLFSGFGEDDDSIIFLALIEKEFDYLLLFANQKTGTPLITLGFFNEDDSGRILFASLMQLISSTREAHDNEDITSLF